MVRRMEYYGIKVSTMRTRKRCGKTRTRTKNMVKEIGHDKDEHSEMDGKTEARARTDQEGKRPEDARIARFLRASALKREANSSLAKF